MVHLVGDFQKHPLQELWGQHVVGEPMPGKHVVGGDPWQQAIYLGRPFVHPEVASRD